VCAYCADDGPQAAAAERHRCRVGGRLRMARWDARDVSTWITRCLKLPYGQAFEAAGIDGYALVELTREDLQQNLGVQDPAHVQQLEAYIGIFRSLLGKQKQVEDSPPAGAAGLASPSVGSPFLVAGYPSTASAPAAHYEKSAAAPPAVYRRMSEPPLGQPPLEMHATTPQAFLSINERLAPSSQRFRSRDLNDSFAPSSQEVRSREASPDRETPFRPMSPSSGQQHSRLRSPARSQLGARRKESPLRHPASPVGKLAGRNYESTPNLAEVGRSSSQASTSARQSTARSSSYASTPFHSHRQYALKDTVGWQPMLGGAGPHTQSFESLSTAAPTQNTTGVLSRTVSQQSFAQQSFAVRAEMAVNDATFGFNTHPSFTKTSTGRMEKPRSPSPGHYQGLSSSLSNSSACFGREPRKTDDRIIIQASLSPGVGRYSPPPRAGAGVHGGSFNRTRRWSHNMNRSPGPCTYRPNHIAKSTFK